MRYLYGYGSRYKALEGNRHAQRTVKISSPYLSPKMVDELIWLHKQGVEVSLITSDTVYRNNGRQEKSIQPLIVQNRHLDEQINKAREHWKKIQRIVKIGSILISVMLVLLFIFTRNWAYVFLLAIPLVFLMISGFLNRKIQRTKIYTYTYSQLFPFRVYVTPDSNRINDMFIHGKIYIVDGHTAYLGSLNFTESGTKYNYETRVRVTEEEAVKKIDAEFDELYDHEDLAYFGIEEWGRQLYHEPIN